jgi:hypothetical protein
MSLTRYKEKVTKNGQISLLTTQIYSSILAPMNTVDQGDVQYNIENGIAIVAFHHPLSNSLPGKALAAIFTTDMILFNQ